MIYLIRSKGYKGFPSSSIGKNLPATQETQVQLLGGEDPLEKEMAIHSSILAWRIPGTEEPGGLPYGVTQSRTQLKRLSSSSKENFHFPCPGFKTLHLQNEVATNWPLHNKDIMQPQANSCWGCQLHMTSHEIQMLLYRFCYFPQCFTPVCHPPVLCKDVSIPSLR